MLLTDSVKPEHFLAAGGRSCSSTTTEPLPTLSFLSLHALYLRSFKPGFDGWQTGTIKFALGMPLPRTGIVNAMVSDDSMSGEAGRLVGKRSGGVRRDS